MGIKLKVFYIESGDDRGLWLWIGYEIMNYSVEVQWSTIVVSSLCNNYFPYIAYMESEDILNRLHFPHISLYKNYFWSKYWF